MYNFLWTVEHNSRAGHNYDKLFTALSVWDFIVSCFCKQETEWS